MAEYVTPRAQESLLFFHRWGSPNDPPTFKDLKLPADGPNVGTLDIIPTEAVLMHRNKDGSLIELLKKDLSKIINPEMPESVRRSGGKIEFPLGLGGIVHTNEPVLTGKPIKR